ncbi:MAG: extracellular solute-binding protein [Oscillospiraceae bacterium]|nr:extracellular solute-binding protein [Oscillospiraceae bacterium]
MRIKKLVCLALAALLLLGFFSGCVQDKREELLEKAEQYLRQGDCALAVRILDTYLEQEPENITAKELYAQYYHATEQFLLEAEAYYRLIKQAQDNDISLEGYYLACAAAYLQLGYREDALEIYQEGAARLPQAEQLRQKADELDAQLHPPGQLSPKPDENGVYHMTVPGEKTALEVIFSGTEEDGALPAAYRQAIESFEEATGHTVSCQTLPQGVPLNENHIKNGLCFIGTQKELDALTAAGVLVSLEEMREEYPNLGEHYREELCGRGPDGKIYALPAAGGWSGLFINQKALKSCGVALPGEGYTWEQFLRDCEAIKDSGKIPIAAEDTEAGWGPWVELGLWNNTPASRQSAALPWTLALEDMKELYDKGYIQKTEQAEDASEAASPFDMLLDGEAVFMLGDDNDCANLAAALQRRDEEPGSLYVTPPPVKDTAKAGQVVGDLTGGWAMSRTVWDDPEKRMAAVSLYSHLTAANIAAGGKEAYLFSALKVSDGAEEKDMLKKMLETSFFPLVRGMRPSTLAEVTAAEGGQWLKILHQVLTEALTPQEAAENLNQTEGQGLQEREKAEESNAGE